LEAFPESAIQEGEEGAECEKRFGKLDATRFWRPSTEMKKFPIKGPRKPKVETGMPGGKIDTGCELEGSGKMGAFQEKPQATATNPKSSEKKEEGPEELRRKR